MTQSLLLFFPISQGREKEGSKKKSKKKKRKKKKKKKKKPQTRKGGTRKKLVSLHEKWRKGRDEVAFSTLSPFSSRGSQKRERESLGGDLSASKERREKRGGE